MLSRSPTLFATWILATVCGGVAAFAPATADACTPNPRALDQLPADGEQVPPDVQLHFASMTQPGSSLVDVQLTDGDGTSVPLVFPNPPSSYGKIAFHWTHYAVAPEQPLEPGSYTLSFQDGSQRTTTFEVSDSVEYATPPSVDSIEWMTQVYDTEQGSTASCEYPYLQLSRITFQRLSPPENRRTLLYKVRFVTVDEFDGDIDTSGGWTDHHSRRVIVVDKASGERFPMFSYSSVDEDTVTLTVGTPFKAECVEVTAIDMTGQQGQTFVDCMPDRCAPPTGDDNSYLFNQIDWSTQPDCAQEYCYGEGCAPATQPDAGTPDAGSPVADVGPDAAADGAPADASDTGADNQHDAADDGGNATTAPDAASSANTEEGFGCAAVDGASPVPAPALALAGLVGGVWFFGRRRKRSA